MVAMNDIARYGQLAHDRHRASLERPRRLLVFALVASLALHVALVTLMPGIRLSPNLPRPLDVLLIEAPSPAPVIEKAETPQPTARAPRKAPQRRVHAEPLANRPSVPAENQQLLALPQAQSSPPSAFNVPQPSAEPAPPQVEQKPPAASTSPAPIRRDTIATTPPSLNAAYLRNAPARYPLIARRNGVEGTVRLKVLVTREGRVAQVHIDQGSGSTALDNAALEAVRDWQFAPARRGAEAIESWILVPVVFKLENAS